MPRSRWPHRPLPRWAFCLVLVWAAIHLVVFGADAAPAPAVSQAFIGFIIAAISAVASWIGAAGAAVATATVAVVQYLAGALAWLGAHVGTFLKSTGAMFAKVWDASKRFWFNVVRPAFQHVIKWITEARDWLKQKLGPIFRLLSKIRERIREVYAKFIKPVLDAIEAARGVLQILAKLHVPFAKTLDRYLAEVESAITENFLQLQGWVIQIQGILTSIVTAELLFQQFPFLASLRRDTPHWVRMFWNAQVRGLTPTARAALAARKSDQVDPAQLRQQLGEFYRTGSGELGAPISELVTQWKIAAGLQANIKTD